MVSFFNVFVKFGRQLRTKKSWLENVKIKCWQFSGIILRSCAETQISFIMLYCIHTKKLSCLKSGVEFDMNDILYEFKNLHHF